MLLIGADPGGTTGIAAIDTRTPGCVTHDQIGPWEHHDAIMNDLDQLVYDHGRKEVLIVCERFDKRPNLKNQVYADTISLEYIGVIKAWAKLRTIRLVLQGASQAKSWATDEKLQWLSYLQYPVTELRHANDALRHLVYFVCNTKVTLESPANQQLLDFRHDMLDKLRRLVVQI